MEAPRTARDPVRRARLALGALLVALLAFLLLVEKPWRLPGGDELFAAHRPLDVTIAVGLWWAAALNALLCAAGIATARHFARPLPALPERPRARAPRGFWLALLLLAGLAGALRWPLAHTSLWHDEAWSVRHVIAGQVRVPKGAPETVATHVPGWRETLWYYEKPVNHPLYSVAARLSTEGWRARGGREAPAFDEFALRVPAWIAAMLSVVALGALLRDWGLPRAALAGAALLAIHPWHIRYGADGRGYAFLVLLALVALFALARALRSGAPRWWALYAASAFGLLWSHLFATYFVLALAAAALLAIWAGPRGARGARAARAVAVHALAGMCFLQLFAPNLLQAAAWTEGRDRLLGRSSSPLSVDSLTHQWALVATGVDSSEPDVPERRPGAYPALRDFARERLLVGPLVWPLVFGALPLLAALGLARLGRRGEVEGWLSLGLALAVPTALLVDTLQRGVWYPRFGIYGLPAFAAFASVGLDGLLVLATRARPRARRVAVPAGLALGLLGFQAFVAPETRVLLERPHAPSREALAALDAALGAERERALRAAFGMVTGKILLRTYDPRLDVAESGGELAALMRRAERERRPLYVIYGRPASNRKHQRAAMRWLGDRRYFREVALLDAIEVEQLLRVMKWTGEPLPSPPGRRRR
jgi:hypothetical protein